MPIDLTRRTRTLAASETPPPPAQTPARPAGGPGTAPDAAAEVLLRYLPDATVELILEVAGERAVPLWHVLLGYVMRCADRGDLFAPLILTLWDSGVPASGPRPCGSCGALFRAPHFPDARYCCPPCYFGKLAQRGHTEDCPVRCGPVPRPEA